MWTCSSLSRRESKEGSDRPAGWGCSYWRTGQPECMPDKRLASLPVREAGGGGTLQSTELLTHSQPSEPSEPSEPACFLPFLRYSKPPRPGCAEKRRGFLQKGSNGLPRDSVSQWPYQPRSLGDSRVGLAPLILGGPLGALPKGSGQKITGLFLGGGGCLCIPYKEGVWVARVEGESGVSS